MDGYTVIVMPAWLNYAILAIAVLHIVDVALKAYARWPRRKLDRLRRETEGE